jgi:predicted O-methyltransferase YrrM
MKPPILKDVFDAALVHRAEHACGGYPYEYGNILTSLIAATNAKRVLEFGTGLGYTALCMALANPDVHIDTIERDESHLEIAKNNWGLFNVEKQITIHFGKAEAIIPEFNQSYDFIFFDGYAPSLKFLEQYDRLLKVDGTLVTANLFVKDPKGGKYLRALQRGNKWHTGVFADTAISVKRY